MKPIILQHKNPLLENYKALEALPVESYVGFIYMWYCIPEQMFYIGSHKGHLSDDYRGSGSRFKKVFEFYGITQFDRIVLEYFSDLAIMKRREQFWLDKFKAVKSPTFYNVSNVFSNKKR